jgi:hypothetical protein
MLKKHVIGVLAAVILVLVLFTGCIQSQDIGVYPGSQEIDIICSQCIDTAIISQYLGIPNDKIDDAISDLDIKAYGINGVSKNSIMAWYENRHLDWNLQKSSDANLFSLRAWSSFFDGHVVAVSDHGSMQNLVGYDTVFLTSSALLMTYDKYLNYL